MVGEMFVPVLKTPHSELRLKRSSHPLIPEGYDWTDEVLVTSWAGVLPTSAFSRAAFRALELLVDLDPASEKEHRAKIAATFFIARSKVEPAKFDENLGCWFMPLNSEYDDKKRARYPTGSIGSLGWSSAGTHQIAYQELLGETIPTTNGKSNGAIKRKPVDHLCHNHACCNPYHLDCVDQAENTIRGVTVRHRKSQTQMFSPEPGNISVDELISYEGYELSERMVDQ